MHYNTGTTDIVKDFVAGEDKIAIGSNIPDTNFSDNAALELVKSGNDVLMRNPFSESIYMRLENIDDDTFALMQNDANFTTYFEYI